MTSSRLLLSFFFPLAMGCAHVEPNRAVTPAPSAVEARDHLDQDPMEQASCGPLPDGVSVGTLPSGLCGAGDAYVYWDGEMCVRTSGNSCLIGPLMMDMSALRFPDEHACRQAHQHCEVDASAKVGEGQ